MSLSLNCKLQLISKFTAWKVISASSNLKRSHLEKHQLIRTERINCTLLMSSALHVSFHLQEVIVLIGLVLMAYTHTYKWKWGHSKQTWEGDYITWTNPQTPSEPMEILKDRLLKTYSVRSEKDVCDDENNVCCVMVRRFWGVLRGFIPVLVLAPAQKKICLVVIPFMTRAEYLLFLFPVH